MFITESDARININKAWWDPRPYRVNSDIFVVTSVYWVNNVDGLSVKDNIKTLKTFDLTRDYLLIRDQTLIII